jgi:hypothetical protein
MSVWICGARNCPGHSSPGHRCGTGNWLCRRTQPPCPGHSASDHQCGTGNAWLCGAKNCPTHSHFDHQCVNGVWRCGREKPPCPGHSKREHGCEAGAALLYRWPEPSAPSPLDRLVRGLEAGSLTINQGDAKVIRAAAAGSATVSIDLQIVNLLNNLLVFGNVNVMSLLRRGQSQHGVVNGNRVTCKAVDIQGYRGIPVQLRPKNVAINVICSILERFPEGQFDIGFPRPVGGPTGFNPADDVFFPVPDLATAQQCWDGTISRSLSQMLQPAQDGVRMAMPPHARFRVLYPDGLNHLHVSVTRNPA